MKKLFEKPMVEVKCLSSENEVMGVFSASAEAPSKVTVVIDDKSRASDDSFSYWSSK